MESHRRYQRAAPGANCWAHHYNRRTQVVRIYSRSSRQLCGLRAFRMMMSRRAYVQYRFVLRYIYNYFHICRIYTSSILQFEPELITIAWRCARARNIIYFRTFCVILWLRARPSKSGSVVFALYINASIYTVININTLDFVIRNSKLPYRNTSHTV